LKLELPLIIAHAGHWIVDLLTILPVLLIALWFLFLAVRDRRRRGTEDDAAPEQPPAEQTRAEP
jgi:hypothetical protein